MADFCRGLRNVLGIQSLVDRLPGYAAVIGAESARGGDGNVDPLGIAGIKNNRVQAHATCSGLPMWSGAMAAQSGELVPTRSAVGRAEQGGVFHPRVDRVRIGERRFEMPHPFELPRVLRAVIKLVRGEGFAGFRRAVINEFIARALHSLWAGRDVASGRLPRFAPVIGCLL